MFGKLVNGGRIFAVGFRAIESGQEMQRGLENVRIESLRYVGVW